MDTLSSPRFENITEANERLATPEEIKSLERIPVDDGHLLAHEALRRSTQRRTMEETGLFPKSGATDWEAMPIPSDAEITQQAREVAALTLGKEATKELSLDAAIKDNTSFAAPPSFESAVLLASAARETGDPLIREYAERSFVDIDPQVAETLEYELMESFGDMTAEQARAHLQEEAQRDAELDKNLLKAKETMDDRRVDTAYKQAKVDRLKEIDQAELTEHDNGTVRYDPFADDEDFPAAS